MIRQHLVRAFERGAGRDHRPNIELERDVCEVTFAMEDSTFLECRVALHSWLFPARVVRPARIACLNPVTYMRNRAYCRFTYAATACALLLLTGRSQYESNPTTGSSQRGREKARHRNVLEQCGLSVDKLAQHTQCMRVFEPTRSSKSGLGHQLTELVFFLELSRRFGAVPKIQPFAEHATKHGESISFLNDLLGLNAFMFENKDLPTAHLKRTPPTNTVAACSTVISGGYRDCPLQTNCFKSPAVSLSFPRFAPCLRSLAEEHGTWMEQRPNRFTSTHVLHVVWHIRVGDIEPREPTNKYYGNVQRGLRNVFSCAKSQGHYVISNWDAMEQQKRRDYEKIFRGMQNVEFLSLSLKDTFLHFLHADFLIGGGSSLPRVAALFSRKPIYLNVAPYTGWSYLAEYITDGFDTSADGSISTTNVQMWDLLLSRDITHKFNCSLGMTP